MSQLLMHRARPCLGSNDLERQPLGYEGYKWHPWLGLPSLHHSAPADLPPCRVLEAPTHLPHIVTITARACHVSHEHSTPLPQLPHPVGNRGVLYPSHVSRSQWLLVTFWGDLGHLLWGAEPLSASLPCCPLCSELCPRSLQVPPKAGIAPRVEAHIPDH